MSSIDLRTLAAAEIQRERDAERQRADAARSAAREQYHRLLLAAADGEPVDAAELRAVMATLGLTVDNVKTDQEEIEAYRERERAVKDREVAKAEADAAREAAENHRRETQRFWRERGPAHAALVEAQTAAEKKLTEANCRAVQYAHALEGKSDLLARVVAHDQERAGGAKARPARAAK